MGGLTVSELRWLLTADTKGLDKGIAQSDKKARGLGATLLGGVKKVAKAGGVAAGAVFGLALTKGLGRLMSIEDAQAKLTGLGHSSKTVAAIMGNALAAVKGTAFGMDEAATTAAGSVAAGIKPGKALERTLKLVADAATIGGTSMSEMGQIFNKVATSGKVQGDVINQMHERGIPIVALLAKTLGKTSEEVIALASKGKIGFTEFQAAIESGMGGAALKSGETTRGAMKNTLAAIGRVGANLLSGIFPKFKGFFQGVMGFLAPLEDGAKNVGEAISGFLVKALDTLTPIFAELTGGIRAFAAAWVYNDGEITSSGFPGFMERVGYIARQVFDEITGGIKAFTAAWTYNDGEVTSSGFPGFMERAGYLARQLFDFLKNTAIPTLANIGGAVLPIVVTALTGLGKALTATIDFFMQHTTAAKATGVVIGAVAALIVAAWVAKQVVAAKASAKLVIAWFKTATAATTSANIQKKSLAQIVISWTVAAAKASVNAAKSAAAWVASTARIVAAWTVQTARAVATNIMWQVLLMKQSARSATATALAWVKAQISTVASLVKMGAAFVAQGARMAASAALTAARVVAGWVLMGVQSMVQAARMAAAWVIAMGPVGWVIAAVIGLVALIIANWDKVKKWTAAAWDWVVKKIKAAWEWVVGLFRRYHPVGIIISHWDKIKAATRAAWDWVRTQIANAIQAVLNTVGKVLAFRDKVVAAFGNLKDRTVAIFLAMRDWVRDRINDLVNTAGKVMAFRDKVIAAFTRLKDAAVAKAQGLVDFVKGIPGKIASAVGSLGSTLYNKGRDLIQGLINGASSLLSRIGSFFLDKVPAFIREPFKKALGIHSPSKVFAGYGKNIGEGVLVGVGRIRPKLDRTMRGLVTVPTARVPLSSAVSAPAWTGPVRGGDMPGMTPAAARAALHIEHFHEAPGSSAQQTAEAFWFTTKARG